MLQGKLAKYEEPILITSDIKKKIDTLARVADPILKKPMPKPVPKADPAPAAAPAAEPGAEEGPTPMEADAVASSEPVEMEQ